MAKKTTEKHAGGRPPIYKGNVKKHIVALIRKHGLTHARRILSAAKGSLLAEQRNVKLVPEPLNISMPTLQKFKKEAGLEVTQGRPTNAVQEKRNVA